MKFSPIRNHRQEPRADRVGSAWSTLGKRGALRRPRSKRAATFASIRPELLVDRLLERPWAGDGECAVVGTGLIDGGPAGVAGGGGGRPRAIFLSGWDCRRGARAIALART